MSAVSPPTSEAELMASAKMLAGRPLGVLAERHGVAVPNDQRRAKGWVGQLLETCLGATAGSKAEPDFQHIGVELKTLPINVRGEAAESTYVCTAKLTDLAHLTWESSWVRKKLSRVLWVPIQADASLAMSDRMVGSPLLWSPSSEQNNALQADWEELTDLIRMGRVEEITGRHGEVLQIRPKAADSKARRWGVDEEGRAVKTLPRGYYLRARFTNALLQAHYARPQ
jgi:DNA mismatch repair protein MutH